MVQFTSLDNNRSVYKPTLDQLASKILQGQKLPNFAFGATSVDQEIYFTTGGVHIVGDPTSGQVAPDSVFWLCSQTKLITHLSALHLIERGKLAPETPVSDYIPELANPVIVNDQNPTSETLSKPATIIMTIKHLLNFSSGLFYPDKRGKTEDLVDAYCQTYSKENALSEFFTFIKCGLPGVPILFEPGTSFAYGWSSDILGFVVEKVSGLTLEQYFQDNIFKPLGVKGSFYLTPDLKEKLVDLAFKTEENLEPGIHRASKQVIEQDPAKVNIHFGGVGLYASLKDYLSILRHLLQINAGKAEKPILEQKTVQTLFEGALTETGSAMISAMLAFVDPFAYKDKLQWSTGLAVCTSDWPNGRKKGTAAWGGWANTNYWIDPTTGIAAVFGTQLVPPSDRNLLEYYAAFEKALYAGLTQ